MPLSWDHTQSGGGQGTEDGQLGGYGGDRALVGDLAHHLGVQVAGACPDDVVRLPMPEPLAAVHALRTQADGHAPSLGLPCAPIGAG